MMDMLVTSTLNNFLNTLIESINSAIYDARKEAIKANSSVIFVANKIDLNLKCSIDYDKDNATIMVTPSNAVVSNYYNKGNESLIRVTFTPIMVTNYGKTHSY
jgi:hypothetical protein